MAPSKAPPSLVSTRLYLPVYLLDVFTPTSWQIQTCAWRNYLYFKTLKITFFGRGKGGESGSVGISYAKAPLPPSLSLRFFQARSCEDLSPGKLQPPFCVHSVVLSDSGHISLDSTALIFIGITIRV